MKKLISFLILCLLVSCSNKNSSKLSDQKTTDPIISDPKSKISLSKNFSNRSDLVETMKWLSFAIYDSDTVMSIQSSHTNDYDREFKVSSDEKIMTFKIKEDNGEISRVIVFRGTKEQNDHKINNDAELKEDNGFNKHHGYTKYLNKMVEMKEIKNFLYKIRGEKIYVTGHSQGGALALLLGHYLKDNIHSYNVKVITFGAPKVGDDDFLRDIKKKLGDNLITVVTANDVVTQLPATPNNITSAISKNDNVRFEMETFFNGYSENNIDPDIVISNKHEGDTDKNICIRYIHDKIVNNYNKTHYSFLQKISRVFAHYENEAKDICYGEAHYPQSYLENRIFENYKLDF